MAFTFEKLIVYQKAISYADCICAITEKFPRGYGFLSDQLNRASVSIAANIAEGNGRFTIPDRKNFFMDRQGIRAGMRGANGNRLPPQINSRRRPLPTTFGSGRNFQNALRPHQRFGKPQNLSIFAKGKNRAGVWREWIVEQNKAGA